MNDRYIPVYSTETGKIAQEKTSKSKKPGAPATNIVNPNKQGVRIQRECKGRGGKDVCVIEGLSLAETELKALAKRLKNKLGTGGAIKNGCIEIQGDHRQALLDLLARENIKSKLSGG